MSDEKALSVKSSSNQLSQNLKNMRERYSAMHHSWKEAERKREEFSAQQTNLIFAVDATGSRAEFWAQTKIVQEQMFFAVHGTGSKLSAKLITFSGSNANARLIESAWCESAAELCSCMNSVICDGGPTQIEKVINTAVKETRPVNALIFVGDSCEEDGNKIVAAAQQLKDKNIQFFLFDDGARSTGRASSTTKVFEAAIKAADGVLAEFDMSKLSVIEEYLRTAAVVATRNESAISRLPQVTRTPEGKKMLEQAIKTLPAPGNK